MDNSRGEDIRAKTRAKIKISLSNANYLRALGERMGARENYMECRNGEESTNVGSTCKPRGESGGKPLSKEIIHIIIRGINRASQ